MKLKQVLLAILAVALPIVAAAEDARWPAGRARSWYAAQPWLVGCNFLPSTAVNDVEMWQAETFDPATIDRELGWARALGFNSVRVFLNYVVWEADGAGLKQRFDRFLAVADRHGIRTMPVLLDDCNFAGCEARVGRQPDPVPGVHNSRWVSSPPLAMVTDPKAQPRLERYVKDMVGTLANDKRIVVWDLYNEPGNSGLGAKSLPLVEASFRWAREMKPTQPLASCWIAEPYSDLVNLHGYGPLSAMQDAIARAKRSGRPVLVTEWMARTHKSRFETHLPLFKAEKIACWSWGFVAGRTQTYFPWGSKPTPGASEPRLWFHDVLRRDGTPYSPREIATIRYCTGLSTTPPPPLPQPRELVPTARKRAITWRSTTEKPAAGWYAVDFDDTGWLAAPAPFGRAEPGIGRQPGTQWTSSDIWLRREFEMPAGKFTSLSLSMHHDEDTEVYVDGVLAAKVAGFNATYESFAVAPKAAAMLKPGKHIMAVHCRQTVGGQYIDVGIESEPGD